MDARKYLGRLQFLDSKIAEDRERVKRLKEQAESRTSNPSPDKVQSSGSQSRQADAICEWVVLEQQIAVDEEKRDEIIDTIGCLPHPENVIIYKVYRYDKSLKEISREVHLSYSAVAKRHTSGLSKVQKILDKRKARD
jgi:DNA-directed RNA polymerase specialized sigma24 family protein